MAKKPGKQHFNQQNFTTAESHPHGGLSDTILQE